MLRDKKSRNIINLKNVTKKDIFSEEVLHNFYFDVNELRDLFIAKEVLLGNNYNSEIIEINFEKNYKNKFENLIQNNNLDLKSDIENLIYEFMILMNNKGILKDIINHAQLFWFDYFINKKEYVIQSYYALKANIDIFDYIEDIYENDKLIST